MKDPPLPGSCAKQVQEVLEIEAYIVAQRFRQLPEPERSALALFYLDLFPPPEIAQLLRVDLEELGEILSRGRSELRRLLNGKA
jgi:DNA-directed RNA polymerase specialized sigma24 family protein